MHAISVKELRQKFPFVRSELSKGVSFLVIHKSRPIATLKPINGEDDLSPEIDDDKELMEEMQNAAAEEWSKLPPITKAEHDYYMSLAPKK